MLDYKQIHIGNHIKTIAELKELSISRACLFLKCSHKDIQDMYLKETLDSGLLLRWCKLLDYNFFMFYHTHLQLHAPSAAKAKVKTKESDKLKSEVKPNDYDFKKNLYMPELIDWIVNKLHKEEISIQQAMDRYQIPKTTIYRWKKRVNRSTSSSTEKKKFTT